MSLTNKKQTKIQPKIINTNSEITYEIDSNDSKDMKQLITEQPYKNKKIDKVIIIPEQFPIKMILGSPKKIRATCSRIIKAGARGTISQQLVNSMVWQLRSLVYFDQVCADLTVLDRIAYLEKELKKYEIL